LNPGADLKYAGVFEVLPEVRLQPLNEHLIERPVASVAEHDLQAMLDTCASSVPCSTRLRRAAGATDRVTVDFTGKIEGTEFEGGSGTAVPIVIGANQVMKEFEDALVGASAGETREFDATFSTDHTTRIWLVRPHLQREGYEGRRAGAGAAR
jgi:trigger factor